MAWWDKVKSAAKSAVNKVKQAVKKVAETIKKTAVKSVKKVQATVKKVKNTVKKKAKKSVKKAKSSVKKVETTVKKSVSKAVDKVKETVAIVKETVKSKIKEQVTGTISKVEDVKGSVKEKVKETIAKVQEKVKSFAWRDVLLDKLKSAFKIKLPFMALPEISAVENIYVVVTGKALTEAESEIFKLKVLDWIVPLNALSKLFYGVNLDGKSEEFGSAGDYTDILLAFAIIVPVGKVGAVATKLGIKAGTKLGFKGFMKLSVTKFDDAAKIFSKLKVDDQMKLIGKLSKTDEGVKLINKLLAKKALNPTLVKPTISVVNKEIQKKIIEGAGLSKWITKITRPKTILWSLVGMGSMLGMAYSVSFGTAWMAKEGIKEQFDIPLSDRMRAYRYEPTIELLEIIKDDIKKLRQALPIAEAAIKKVAWLWPPTKEMWYFYADNLYFTIEQYERELEILIPSELIEIPEKVKATVRDIIDGDTIDVSLDAINQETGKEIKLPQYKKTGHARVRIVGINAPEKSPKGEILCSDVEISKVEKKFADESRDRLLPLNDKEVLLKVDPEIPLGTHGRILAVVEHGGTDIGLRQIKEGLACGYYREPHKYFDEDEYSDETLKAKDKGVGMWKGLEEVEKEEDKIKIKITSVPTNARLFLDDVALRHNTPSDEVELSDVLHLLTLGSHVLSAEKAGLSAMLDWEIVKGDNGTIHLTLETEPIPEVPTEEEIEEEELEEELIEEEVEEEKIEEEIIEEIKELVKPAEIPKEYTDEQVWALKEAFAKILILTESRAVMSGKEREDLINSFVFYTDGQKEVLKLLWQDLTFYTQGRNQLSADEFILLKEKYRMLGV